MNISIIIPVFNASQYLRECLDSVFSQTFDGEYEVIAVNDGSTDDSLAICMDYASKHENMKVLTGENAGVSAARNKALDAAQGEWLVFVDADDKMLPDALSTLYNRWMVTNADMVLANAVRVENGVVSKPFLKLSNETLPNVICHIKHFALWGYLIPAKIVKQYNIRFVDGLAYSEDRIFIYQLAKYCQTIAYTETPIYVYRINPTSACKSKDGIRKAKHHFLAAYHLHQIAATYQNCDKSIFTHLVNEANHVIDLGIYMFLQQTYNFKQLREIKEEYNRLFGTDMKWNLRFYKYVVIDFLTIQRRKLITFKK